jgi:rod shape-determining protein MreD
MRGTWIAGVLLFLAGWIGHLVYLHLVGSLVMSPYWLLLIVLTLGGMGHARWAMTLGFFWGLCLDVFGISLFGAQGLLLAAAGWSAGRLSRQLNAEKLITQEALALAGTLFYIAGLWLLEVLFRTDGAPHRPAFWMSLLDVFLNVLAAPLVYWVMSRVWPWAAPEEEGHASSR